MSVVGVNVNNNLDENTVEGQILDQSLAIKQVDFLNSVRDARDEEEVRRALDKLKGACGTEENLMEHIIFAVKSYCSIGEINSVLTESFGTWVSPSGV